MLTARDAAADVIRGLDARQNRQWTRRKADSHGAGRRLHPAGSGMMRASVGAWLTAWFSAILAMALLAAAIGVRLGTRQSIHDAVDRDLHARLEGMRQFLHNIS